MVHINNVSIIYIRNNHYEINFLFITYPPSNWTQPQSKKLQYEGVKPINAAHNDQVLGEIVSKQRTGQKKQMASATSKL